MPSSSGARLEIRPTVGADLAHVAWRNQYRLRAWTAILHPREGHDAPAGSNQAAARVLGIGGIQLMDNGTLVAFVDLTPEARCYPLSLHRTAVRFMRELRRAGIRRVVATADPAQPAAERWLERLGFVPVEPGPGVQAAGPTVYLWQG